jgi:hypothetical protein
MRLNNGLGDVVNTEKMFIQSLITLMIAKNLNLNVLKNNCCSAWRWYFFLGNTHFINNFYSLK